MKLPDKIHAMGLDKPGQPLQYKELPLPVINAEQVLVKVLACGVCRTDLHVVDAELGNINIFGRGGTMLCSQPYLAKCSRVPRVYYRYPNRNKNSVFCFTASK